MKQLFIIQCPDSLMWYADKVGQLVPFHRDGGDCWWSREPAGYVNIVRREDAQLVESFSALERRAGGDA